MKSRTARAFLALVAVFGLFAGLFALGSADAQTPPGNNVRPKASFERVDSNGQVLDGFYYAAEPQLNLVRLSMIPHNHRDGTTVTYQDFGYLQIFYEKTSGANRQLHADASQRWVASSGTALAACTGDGSRCNITKTDWQALAGQTGAADTDVVNPITIGFKVPASIAADNLQIRVLTKHVPSAATRTAGNPGNGWGTSDWTLVQPHNVTFTPLNSDGEPIPGDFVFSNAAGNLGANLQHVRLSIGGGGIDGFAVPTYANWGTGNTAGVALRIAVGSTWGTNLADGQVSSIFFQADGTTAAGCSSGDTDDCFLDKAAWQALAGQTGAADTAEIKPARLAFKVPDRGQSDSSATFTGGQARLQSSRTGAVDNDGQTVSAQQANQIYTRLNSQVFRYQSGSRAANGARTPLEPGTPLPSGSTHVGLQCQTGHTGTDCTRALEVGEYLYVAQALLSGGPSLNDGRLNRAGSSWLAYGPEHFDQIEVSYVPANAGGGDAIVVHDTLCPINVADAPEHPFADAPRDRTATALRVCKFDIRSYYGATYRTVDNPGGNPYWAAGTGPLVIGTKAGAGTVTVKHTKSGTLVGQGSFPLTIAAATPARLSSDADDPVITAELGQRTADDSLVLLIGYQRDRGIPLHWGWHRTTFIGNVGYVGPARYEDVTSVALTVPAGGGTLRLLGTNNFCTAETAACTITLDKADLKQAARYRYAPAMTPPAIADTDPIFPPALRFHHATAADVTITGVLTNADSTTHNFSYTANASASAAAISINAHLRGDADRILEPGQSANVAVGYQLPQDEIWTDASSSNDGTFAQLAYAFGVTRPYALHTITGRRGTITASAALAPAANLLEARTLQTLTDRGGDWTWKSYSPGGTDFTVEAGDPLWIGSGEPPVTSRYSAVPAVWSIGSYNGNIEVPARSSEVAYPQPADVAGAYLEISGPAAWVATGGKRLALEGSAYAYFTCAASSTLDSSLSSDDRTCFITDAQGRGPVMAVDADASGRIRIIANLPAWQLIGASPADDLGGTASSPVIVGFERPRNTHAARRLGVFGTDSIEIRSVGPVASAALARASGATGVVRTGDPARLELAILDENGNAARAASLSSITLTTTSGKLRAGTSEGGSQLCSGGTTCVIPVRDSDSDDGNDLVSASATRGSLLAKIFVDLYDVKTAGTATVAGTVVAAASSGDPVYRAEPLTVVFSGTAARLSLSEKLLRVNAYGTPDEAVAADPDADPPVAAVAKDDRDLIKIAVTAADSRDQTAGIPVQTAITVTGPGGAAVPAGALSASIPDDECNTGRTSCNIVIDVNAPRATPLASGEYTVKVTSGSLTAAEAKFGVAGDPAELNFQTADPGAIGTQFESVITVTDAAGEPVADGTPVAITVESRGRRIAVPVSRISAATQPTVNGRITARFVVIGREVATIKAEAGAIARLAVVDTREALTSEEAAPASSLASAAPNTFTAWTGAGTSTASRLLADSPGVDRVFFWNGVRWVLYAESGGIAIPGSLDFLIQPGDVLWLGSTN